MNKLKRSCTLLLLAALIFSAMPFFTINGVSEASSTRSMKTYGTIKSGNTVYCIATGGLYIVNLKTKKVKRLEKIEYGNWIGAKSLKKKGNYLYYIKGGPASSYVYRVKTTGGKAYHLFGKAACNDFVQYTIYKNKLYVNYVDPNNNKKNKVMKLNGKSKKSTSIVAKQIEKKTNKKGYYTTTKFKEKDGYTYGYDYLKTPSGSIYLGKSGF